MIRYKPPLTIEKLEEIIPQMIIEIAILRLRIGALKRELSREINENDDYDEFTELDDIGLSKFT